MRKTLSRREFLKLLAVLPPSVFASKFMQAPVLPHQTPDAKNIIIIVFDALSAKNISLYGYKRNTMPNLSRIAEHATVYHNHFSGGNFTTPGVASLLTGTYPWTHRAVGLGTTIAEDRKRKNLFSAFSRYYRLAYSHNNFVNSLLRQIREDVDYIKPQKDLFVRNNLAFDRLFPWDNDIASVTWERAAKRGTDGYSYSLFLSEIYERYTQSQLKKLGEDFPRGITRIGEDDYFLLEDGINWVKGRVTRIQQPFIGYFHFLPPHRPYCPRRQYRGAFDKDDVGYLINKPKHVFNQSGNDNPISLNYQATQRQWYDEFILYSDSELGRLYDSLQGSGLLDNTWFIFTSDHGEMFERGIFGHRTPSLFQPVVRVPLVIVEPGQRERRDIHALTSAVDLLPTLMRITDQQVPDWSEGEVLPPFSGSEPRPDRSVYAVEAKFSDPERPLNPASAMIVKANHKLAYYRGYEELGGMGTLFELYDLEADPEEMIDLYPSRPEMAVSLKDELLERFQQADKPFR